MPGSPSQYQQASTSSSYETFSSAQPFTTRSVTIVESVEVAEITEADGEYGVAAALRYCKTRVLVPYLRILSVIGLRPVLSSASGHWPKLYGFISAFYLLLVIAILIFGYVLQYLACFRRDRGPHVKPDNGETEKILDDQCPGSLLFNFIIPSTLHLFTYLYTLHLFRLRDNENLQNLMERVFVVSCTPGEGTARPKSLARCLWLLIGLAMVWFIVVTVTSGYVMLYTPPSFRWLEQKSLAVVYVLRFFLFLGTVAQDIFQATLVSGYCLQAQLLATLAVALKQRLLQHTLSPLDWMREMREFRELLRHLNQQLAPAVCVLGFVSTSWTFSAAAWLLGWTEPSQPIPMFGVSFLPVILWSLVTIVPFIQAARLSAYCYGLRGVGHEVRARPFVYHDTPSEELDSLLLFSSSLRLRACLCGTPISGRCLWLVLVTVAVIALTLGQIQRLPLPWPQ